MSSQTASDKATVLVTGANQGLGYHVVSQLAAARPNWLILLGCRTLEKGEEAAKQIHQPNVRVLLLDIDSVASIQRARDEILAKYGKLNVLINNAAMAFKGNDFNHHIVKTTFHTNYFGTLAMLQEFVNIIEPHGRIINVSSMAGRSAYSKLSNQLKEKVQAIQTVDELNSFIDAFHSSVARGSYLADGYPETGYGMSKLVVSKLTNIYSQLLKPNNITVVACCPGWCRTSMAGDRAPRSAEDGAATIAFLALLDTAELAKSTFWEDKHASSGL